MVDASDLTRSEYWHVFCQQFVDAFDGPPQTPLDTQGYVRLPMLPTQTAGTLLRHVKRRIQDPDNVDYRSRQQDFLVLPETDEPLFLMMLGKICDGELGALIREHFQAEFTVIWAKFLSTLPEARPFAGVDEPFNPTDRLLSTMWHRDDGGFGPFVHVILYLNDFPEHGGATEFLDLDTSRKIVAAGCTHPDLEMALILKHTGFEEAMDAHGISHQPFSFEPVAGEGVVFDAPNCFHRELLPSEGTRHVMLLAMAPSPLPWRDSYTVRPTVRPKEGVSVWNDEFMKSLYEEVVERRLMPKNDRWRDLMAAGSASPGD